MTVVEARAAVEPRPLWKSNRTYLPQDAPYPLADVAPRQLRPRAAAPKVLLLDACGTCHLIRSASGACDC